MDSEFDSLKRKSTLKGSMRKSRSKIDNNMNSSKPFESFKPFESGNASPFADPTD